MQAGKKQDSEDKRSYELWSLRYELDHARREAWQSESQLWASIFVGTVASTAWLFARRPTGFTHRTPLWEKIIVFVVTCVAATFVISSRLTPIYESSSVIDIDRRMPTGILGQEAMQSATNDADQFLATQVKLIQADAVPEPGTCSGS